MADINADIEKAAHTALYITTSVVISDNEVIKDGQTIFSSVNTNVSEFLHAIHSFTGAKYQRFYKMDALSKLGWLAAEILLDEQYKACGYPADQTGIILSNANSSLDTDAKYHESMLTIPSPALFVYTLPNIVIGEIAIRHG